MVGDKAEIILVVKGLVDPLKEIAKLDKQKSKQQQQLASLEKKLVGPSAAKMPPHILEKEKLRGYALKYIYILFFFHFYIISFYIVIIINFILFYIFIVYFIHLYILLFYFILLYIFNIIYIFLFLHYFILYSYY